MSIRDNITRIKDTVPANITILAATKTRTIKEIIQAIDAGIKIIGENYVQEAEKKFHSLKGKAEFHLIGHLQTNKVKKAVNIFDMIQTVDSLKLAKEISRQCKKINRTMPVLIEINIAKEPNKTGILPEKVTELVQAISGIENIRIKGLMTMAPYFEKPEKARHLFKQAKELFEKIRLLNIENTDMKVLSMGMSSSFKVAIEEGATLIRLGDLIFGKRKKLGLPE